MRLWHQDMISILPRQQLLGQHRECCALRGKGWKKRHSTVNYIFDYDLARLYCYHLKVMDEMKRRGYNVDKLWMNPSYRGKEIGFDNTITYIQCLKIIAEYAGKPYYKEHDYFYYRECLLNLKNKGVFL